MKYRKRATNTYYRVRLAEISTADHSIFKHEPKGRAAEAYHTLVKEVMDIGEKQRSKSANISR